MEFMNFPPQFRAWIRTLHRGATTKLILLSKVIEIIVSERHGDPWAMTGFIIQFEPFLKALMRVVTGVTLGLPRSSMFQILLPTQKKSPAFKDDFLILTTNPQDLLTVDQLCQKFEEQSGALLCRNRRSKIIFLGKWRSPEMKPKLTVQYLREVDEAKVFGFIVKPTLKETVERSWEDRVQKMRVDSVEVKKSPNPPPQEPSGHHLPGLHPVVHCPSVTHTKEVHQAGQLRNI